MKHIKNNLVPVSIFVLAVISFRRGRSQRQVSGSRGIYTVSQEIPFYPGPDPAGYMRHGYQLCHCGGSHIRSDGNGIFRGPETGGGRGLMFVTGASIVLSILFGMMVAALLNRPGGVR